MTAALSAAALHGARAAGPVKIVYPNLNGSGKGQLGFQVLQLALTKAGQPFELEFLERPANPSAVLDFLRTGTIDIFDSGTSAAFEQEFLPIYLPIDRGLNGWRLFIVRKERAADFARVKGIEDLRRLTFGQGSGAPDIKVLEHAGLHVVTASTWPLLFPMLENGRFDAIPLGVNEVYGFLDRYRSTAPSATVESHVLLIYPFGRLFFVRRDRPDLRDRVERGLKAAFDDGSFQALFARQPSLVEALANADLKSRVAIRIGNPLMTGRFGQIPGKYFFEL